MERILLIGAGFSVNARVPTAQQMADDFLVHVDNSNILSEEAKRLLFELRDLYREDKDIEYYIALLDFLLSASDEENPISDLMRENELFKELKNKKNNAIELRDEVYRFIHKVGFVTDMSRLDYLNGLQKVFGHLSRGSIFSFNYDTVIEQFYHKLSIEIVDGFQQEFDDQLFTKKEREAILLYKMHGSVTWYKTPTDKFVKILVFNPTGQNFYEKNLVFLTNEKITPLIVYPHEKGYPDLPFPIRRMRDHFSNKLFENTNRDAHNKVKNLWIAIGYSFRDKYVVQMFQDAAREDPNLYMLIISPSATKIATRLGLKSDGEESHLVDRIIPLPTTIENTLPEIPKIAGKLGNLIESHSNLLDLSFPGLLDEFLSIYWIDKALEYIELEKYREFEKLEFWPFFSYIFKCLLLLCLIRPEKKKQGRLLYDILVSLIELTRKPNSEPHWKIESLHFTDRDKDSKKYINILLQYRAETIDLFRKPTSDYSDLFYDFEEIAQKL